MPKYIFLFVYLFVFSLFNIQANESPVKVAYFAEWSIYGRNYHVADLPADKLTHVIYAFAKIDDDGKVAMIDPYAATGKAYPGDTWNEPLKGNFKQLKLLKKKHPHLKTLIAIGGWTLSDGFTDIALTDESRAKFASSAVLFMKTYGFDGIDIDWEYPMGGGIAKSRPEDKQNFTKLMTEIRSQLIKLENQTGKKYLLTVASAAGDALNHYELGNVAGIIDWYNLMTYDFHGAWEKSTNHNAALSANQNDNSEFGNRYNISYGVGRYIAEGVPPNKIVLGIPLYSRRWAGVSPDGKGLFQPADGPSKGTWEPGILDYKDIMAKLKNSNGYSVYTDQEAQASWIYNADLEGGVFYTYEDLVTVHKKVEFIRETNLRGAMFWEVSGDTKDENSIIKAVSEAL